MPDVFRFDVRTFRLRKFFEFVRGKSRSIDFSGVCFAENIQEISYTTESSLPLFDGLSCSTTTFSGDVTEELCTEVNLKDGYISSDGMEFSQTIQEGDGCLDDLDLFACLDGESE